MKKKPRKRPPEGQNRASDLILADSEKKVAALVYYSFQSEDTGGNLEAIFTDYLDRKIKGE